MALAVDFDFYKFNSVVVEFGKKNTLSTDIFLVDGHAIGHENEK